MNLSNRPTRPSPQRAGRTRTILTGLAILAILVIAACGSTGPGTASDFGSSSNQQSQQPISGSDSGSASSGASAAPSDAAANLQEVLSSGGQPSTQLPTAGQYSSLQAFMSAVALDVATDWSARFQRAGYTYTPTHYNWVTGSNEVQAGAGGDCGLAGDPDYYTSSDNPPSPAFACKSDLTVYMSVQWANDHLLAGDGMAVATAIAHEEFHLVQDMEGIAPPPGATDVSSIELQADCGAGVWANDKYYSGQLQAGDPEAAAAAVAAVGDNEFGPQHHGTSAQRKAAFMLGYNTGDVSQCTLDLATTLGV